MNNFWKALIATAVPIVVLSIIGTVGIWTTINSESVPNFAIAWFVGLVLWIGALITAIVFAVTGRRQLSAGIFAGVGIGFLVLGTTCFAGALGSV